MRRSRVGPDDHELHALDPVTGEEIATAAASVVVRTRPRSRRSRRLRIVSVSCAVLAVACAGEAAYFAMTARAVSGLERTWRRAMAVDEARATADGRIISTLESFGDVESIDHFLIAIGSETSAALAELEGDLRRRRILDRRVSELRDQMAEALRFRQLQMSSARRRLGDRPIVTAEAALRRHMRRWGLAPTDVPPARLRSVGQALTRLERFTDEPTGTVIAALRIGELLTIDVDAGTVRSQPVAGPVGFLLGVGDDTVVVTGKHGISAYHLYAPPGAPPRWSRRGVAAHPLADADGLWVDEGGRILRLRPDGEVVDGPFVVPRDTIVVAAMRGGLVLSTFSETREDVVELWDPVSGSRTTLATSVRRFIGAGPTIAVVESPRTPAELERDRRATPVARIVDPSGKPLDRVDFPSDVALMAQRPGSDEVAVAVGPLAGRIASLFRIAPGAAVVGLQRPRAVVTPGSLAWAPSGDALFWLTPDGALALHHVAMRRSQPLRSSLRDVEQIVALEARQ